MLELKVEFLNINPGYNEQLKQACESLREYCLFVERIREIALKEGEVPDRSAKRKMSYKFWLLPCENISPILKGFTGRLYSMKNTETAGWSRLKNIIRDEEGVTRPIPSSSQLPPCPEE